MQQQINYCRAPDGVRIAYAKVGQGKPLVKGANWMNHLEFDWQSPIQRHLLRGLARNHTLSRLALAIARDKQENADLFDVLSYTIREVVRNVFEHSRSDSLYYCAQYWPKSNRVEFAIADFGVGIRRGLGQNPTFRFHTDKLAIEYSLLPSVSGKTHRPRTSEVWHNSGYGLYMTNRLAVCPRTSFDAGTAEPHRRLCRMATSFPSSS